MLAAAVLSALLAVAQTAEPAPAAPATEAPAATEQQQPAADEERRCRMVRMENSNLRQRVCRTAAEEEALNAASARDMREMQSNSSRFGRTDN